MSILVATDLSDHSRHAVVWAAALAAARKEQLLVAYVVEKLDDDDVWTALFNTPDEIEQHVVNQALERARVFAQATLAEHPSPAQRKILIAVGDAVDEVRRFADEFGAELIVAGTTGHSGLHNVVFGNTARRFTHHQQIPMVFVPGDAPPPPAKHILVAIDFSACARAALTWAAAMAKSSGAKLTVVHALGVTALSPDYEPTANYVPNLEMIEQQRREQLDELLAEAGVAADAIIDRGAPAEAVADIAQSRGADLVAMGTHGRGAVGQFFLGSVANRVLRNASCAVATIPAPEEAE